MTMSEFQLLNEVEQEEVVWEKGVFLANYVRGDSICDVYQLIAFYVKFCYLLSTHGNATITAFNNPGQLPFLKEIDISGL